MKQIIQDLKGGKTILEEVPTPMVRDGHVLIKTSRSLVSLGTERMLVQFGKANYLQKARQQPEKVKMVLNKIKSDGLKPTVDAVFRKLNEPMPLGYCQTGEVVEVGSGVDEIQIGDRVVSNGSHAEYVCVPQNLVAKIPDNVSYDEAVFTVIGAIALQGIRLIHPGYGETVVVTGLGLIGLIAAQLLQANGCHVIGLDFDAKKIEMAQSWGIDAVQVNENIDVVNSIMQKTNEVGADAVLITASTKSSDVIAQAAQMSRQRGKIVLVGVIGLDINRADFYEKELSFQVSCSYGPGRYDSNYEQKGMDYPVGFVRWTEKRNFNAILQSLAKNQLDVTPLITEKIPLEEYEKIYGNMDNGHSIASILEYSSEQEISRTVLVNKNTFAGTKGVLGIIGAGNFTNATILPVLKSHKASIKYISSAGGLSAKINAKKFNISAVTTDYKEILKDTEVDGVVITTRHNNHAVQVIESLQAGKHVFVEKPLALNMQELGEIESAKNQSGKAVMVGFNRRFSPFVIDIKKRLGTTPINVIANMNAGSIPSDHWLQDLKIGGGRIIGEACHLIDLITYLTGSLVKEVIMNAHGKNPSIGTDNVCILLKYENGSMGTINYFSNGHKGYSKERIEVYDSGKTMIVDNFRSSKYYGCKSSGMSKTQDKGHKKEFELFLHFLKNGGEVPISFSDIKNTTLASFGAIQSLQENRWIKID